MGEIGGRHYSVAMLAMVIMIVVITQLPSTSHGMVMNNNTVISTTTGTTTIFTISSSSGTAGNATRCNGHTSIKGECLQLNIEKNINNIVDDDVEGDELGFDMELKYAMMEMVDMYSDSTTFITRFLGEGGGGTGPSRHPDQPYCERGGIRYYENCNGPANKGNPEHCVDPHQRTCEEKPDHP